MVGTLETLKTAQPHRVDGGGVQHFHCAGFMGGSGFGKPKPGRVPSASCVASGMFALLLS